MMKKILLTTTAIISSLVPAVQLRAADPVQLELGGRAIYGFFGNAITDDSMSRRTALEGDTEIYFSGSTRLDNNITVGVKTELEVAGGNVGANKSGRIDETYVYFEHDMGGVIQLGDDDDATNHVAVWAPSASPMGANGSFFFRSEGTAGAAMTPASDSTGISGDATKIIYKSPRIGGLMLVASYAPDASSEKHGDGIGYIMPKDGRISDSYSVGVNFNRPFGPVEIELGGGLAYGSKDKMMTTMSKRENSWLYTGGIQLGYAGFKIGGGYIYNYGKPEERDGYVQYFDVKGSQAHKKITAQTQKHSWAAGLTYEMGPVIVGGHYARAFSPGGRFQNENHHVQSAGLDAKYNMGPGVNVFAGLQWYKGTTTRSNHRWEYYDKDGEYTTDATKAVSLRESQGGCKGMHGHDRPGGGCAANKQDSQSDYGIGVGVQISY